MTAVIESERRVAHMGSLKVIVIQTSATCASGHTIDLLGDSNVGQVIDEIYLTLVQDDTGIDEDATWDPDTGIITLGTLTATGIHNITIIGR